MRFLLVWIITNGIAQPILADQLEAQRVAENELRVCLYFAAFDYIGFKFSPKMADEALNGICPQEKHRYDLKMNQQPSLSREYLEYEEPEAKPKLIKYSQIIVDMVLKQYVAAYDRIKNSGK